MAIPSNLSWQYLAPKPKSRYKQLFIKGRHISARSLFGHFMSAEDPWTPQFIAEQYNLPVEVVMEAIAYCQMDPPEIRADWEMDEASIREMVRKGLIRIHPAMTNPPRLDS